ncbi:epidermal growth factor-like protein 6 [Ptychodera flava]|uniref:epidermal growth factor-like protein 6 n=1 Tax=Ptychodera flava TaxID=63121 RepID=UPI00396A6455
MKTTLGLSLLTTLIVVVVSVYANSSITHVCTRMVQVTTRGTRTILTHDKNIGSCKYWSWGHCNNNHRTMTRIGYQTAYRTVFEEYCCDGWTNLQNGTCTTPICSERCENGGRCIIPNLCECTPNFSGPTCDIDVNECLTNNGGCDHSCINNHGSYSCVCQVGFILAIDAHNCEVQNHCESMTCQQHCMNILRRGICYCDLGYYLNDDGVSCNDVNECGNGGCDQSCENTIGSYVCGCTVGYVIDLNGHTCNDVNECNDNNGGCNNICVNTEGSYHCACQESFTLGEDGKTCQN